jgi:glycosyltransferase involved in cell wall biosynthesis
MIIWIVNHYAISPKQAGGTRHFSFAKELTKRGHDVTLFLSSCSPIRTDKQHPSSTVEFVDGVRLIQVRTPSYWGNSWGRIKNMLVFAGRFWAGACFNSLPAPDVILGSSPHLFAALAAERVASRLSVPFVLEVRDLWPLSLIEVAKVSPRHPLPKLLGVIEKHLYRRATRIVTLPAHAAHHMVDKGARPEKVIWISNGVDLSYIPDSPPPKPNGRFTVMYAGAHGTANSLDSILDAALVIQSRHPNHDLFFRFLGEGTQKERLMRRVQQEQIKNFSFEPALPKAEIYTSLLEADLFLAPARNVPLYDFGISFNKLFDYMAAARPIVFGARFSNAAVEAGAAIAVNGDDPEELAGAILKVRHMPIEERCEMGQRGRRHVEKHYSFELLSTRLERTLTESIAEFRPLTRTARAYVAE